MLGITGACVRLVHSEKQALISVSPDTSLSLRATFLVGLSFNFFPSALGFPKKIFPFKFAAVSPVTSM